MRLFQDTGTESRKVFLLSYLTKTLARGIVLSINVLYFKQVVLLSANQVGAGLTIAACAGVLAGAPAGRLVDIFGSRTTTLLFATGEALAIGCYPFCNNFAGFAIISSFLLIFEVSGDASRGALLVAVIPPHERLKTRAYLRSMSNLGVSAGAGCAALALHLNDLRAYNLALVLCSILYAASGLLCLKTRPSRVSVSNDRANGWAALCDKPFVALTAVNGILYLRQSVLSVILPLWIVQCTHAPAVLFSVVVVLNTGLVVVLQLVVGRSVDGVRQGARAQQWSGCLLAASFICYAAAAGGELWITVVFLLLGSIVHVFGEILHAAGSWAVSYGIASDNMQGQYQGFYATSKQLAGMVGPGLLTVLILDLGGSGWIALAAATALGGGIAGPLARWADRTRGKYVGMGHPTTDG